MSTDEVDEVDDTRQKVTAEELEILRRVLDHRTSCLKVLFDVPEETPPHQETAAASELEAILAEAVSGAQ